MKRFGEDFKEDVALDKLKLEVESEALSSIYSYYASQQAEAHAEADRAKKEVERVRAVKELSIRRDPPTDVKLTEGSVLALVQEASVVQEAEDKLLQANAKLYNLDAVIYALNQKKTGLDNLVQLWQRGYYGSGSARTDADDMSDDMHRKHNGGK